MSLWGTLEEISPQVAAANQHDHNTHRDALSALTETEGERGTQSSLCCHHGRPHEARHDIKLFQNLG